MKIESRIPEITREPLTSGTTDNTVSRQRSVTSDPTENSARRANAMVSQASVKEAKTRVLSLPPPIDVKGAIEKLNELVQSQRTNVSFSVDEDAHATVIKVFKTETGELIKQFPPEEILAMKAKIARSVGWLYDSKA